MDEVFGSENFVSHDHLHEDDRRQPRRHRRLGERRRLPPLVRAGLGATQVPPALSTRSELGGVGARQYYVRRAPDGLGAPTDARASTPSRRRCLPDARPFSLDRSDVAGRAATSRVRRSSSTDATYPPGAERVGRRTATGMDRLQLAGRLSRSSGNTLRYVRYLDDFPAFPLDEPLGRHRQSGIRRSTRSTSSRPTTKVVERCMLMTTDPGDLVLDPTCGSGTTAYVAEQWGRRWITIDTSRVALALARQRLMGAQLPLLPARRLGRGPREGERARRRRRCRRPSRPTTSATGSSTSGCSTSRSKSIANNPDIKEGMTPRGDRRGDPAARRVRAALRQAVRGQAARCASPGRSRSRACRRTGRSAFAGSAVDGSRRGQRGRR